MNNLFHFGLSTLALINIFTINAAAQTNPCNVPSVELTPVQLRNSDSVYQYHIALKKAEGCNADIIYEVKEYKIFVLGKYGVRGVGSPQKGASLPTALNQ